MYNRLFLPFFFLLSAIFNSCKKGDEISIIDFDSPNQYTTWKDTLFHGAFLGDSNAYRSSVEFNNNNLTMVAARETGWEDWSEIESNAFPYLAIVNVFIPVDELSTNKDLKIVVSFLEGYLFGVSSGGDTPSSRWYQHRGTEVIVIRNGSEYHIQHNKGTTLNMANNKLLLYLPGERKKKEFRAEVDNSPDDFSYSILKKDSKGENGIWIVTNPNYGGRSRSNISGSIGRETAIVDWIKILRD